jgi:hypothetical protein
VQFRSDEESDDFWVGGQCLGLTVNGQVGLFVNMWHISDGLFALFDTVDGYYSNQLPFFERKRILTDYASRARDEPKPE